MAKIDPYADLRDRLGPLDDDRGDEWGQDGYEAPGEPQTTSPHWQAVPTIRLMDLSGLDGTSPPYRRWEVDGLIPHRQVTLLSADGGTGKTTLALQLQVAKALGAPWLGREVMRGSSFGLYCEDDEEELHRRLAAVCKLYDVRFSDISDRVLLQSRADLPSELLHYKGPADTGTPTPFFDELLQFQQERKPGLLILDSLHDFFVGNEILRPHARRFVASVRQLVSAAGGSGLIDAHPSQHGITSGTGSAGSTGWNNAVRSRLYLVRDGDDKDARILETMKANYGPIGSKLHIRWSDGAFIADAPDAIRAATAEWEFLRLLEEAHAKGLHPSDSVHSQNYAPKLLTKRLKSTKKPRELEDAMNRLFTEGAIQMSQVRTAQRKLKDVIVATAR